MGWLCMRRPGASDVKAAEKGRLLSSPAMITNHDSASQRRWQKMVDPNKDMTLPPQVRTATTVDKDTLQRRSIMGLS